VSRDLDYAPFRDDLTSAGWDLLPLTYRPNLKILTTPIMKICKAVQNGETGVVWGGYAGFVANSKYKIQALFKDPNCIFQALKLSTKSHILDTDIQNLDCIQVLDSKLSTNAKYQNLQDLNSRTFHGFSSTFTW